MRILLDECIPRKLKGSLSGHDCRTVPEEDWAGKKNGELLKVAETAGFQAFVTIDRGIKYQQNLKTRTISIAFIRTKSSRMADLLPLVSQLLQALGSLRPGRFTTLG